MTTYISPVSRAAARETDNAPAHPRASRSDQRGIALQTVIIMVVLLAIAGAIAAVLLSTGSETAGQLEGTDTTGAIDTAAECSDFELGTNTGTPDTTAGTCTWQNDEITRTGCRLIGGDFTARVTQGTPADPKCVTKIV